jgi:hypothetical protein
MVMDGVVEGVDMGMVEDTVMDGVEVGVEGIMVDGVVAVATRMRMKDHEIWNYND